MKALGIEIERTGWLAVEPGEGPEPVAAVPAIGAQPADVVVARAVRRGTVGIGRDGAVCRGQCRRADHGGTSRGRRRGLGRREPLRCRGSGGRGNDSWGRRGGGAGTVAAPGQEQEQHGQGGAIAMRLHRCPPFA